MKTSTLIAATATALVAVAVVTTPAAAGPPLICHAIDIGDAKCLALPGKGSGTQSSHPSPTLAADTLAILGAARDVPVHMETLRRATIAVGRDEAAALELVAALMARTLDAAASGAPASDAALTWLDAGYALACLRQNGVTLDFPAGKASGIPGYAWVKRAIALDGGNAGLQFAAALVTADIGGPECAEHVAQARALAGDRTLVARNLSEHAAIFGDRGHRPQG